MDLKPHFVFTASTYYSLYNIDCNDAYHTSKGIYKDELVLYLGNFILDKDLKNSGLAGSIWLNVMTTDCIVGWIYTHIDFISSYESEFT